MLKKFISIILCLLPFVAQAQSSIGDWRIHPVFGSGYTNIIETGSKVFYLVDGCLFSYDKTAAESESYTKRNSLNDIDIRNIYYNYSKKYLLIAYANSNIDILRDDESTINIPDIKDASLNVSKTINDVAFAGDNVYIATGFGYVVLNDSKFEVKTTQNIKAPIASIGIVGSKILFCSNNQLYIGDVGKQYFSLSEYTATAFKENGSLLPIDSTSLFFGTGYLHRLKINSDGSVSWNGSPIQSGVNSLKVTNSGFSLYDNDGYLYLIDAAGNITSKTLMPQAMRKSIICTHNPDGTLWELNAKGIRSLKLSESGTETVLTDFFRPNASSVKIPYYLMYNNDQKQLYVFNTGTNTFFNDYNVVGHISSYDGTTWKDLTPETVPTLRTGLANTLYSPYSPVIDPDDPSTYYLGSWYEGIYKFTDNKVVAKYDWTNSPLVNAADNFYCNTPVLQFDKNKNLWTVQPDNKTAPVIVLPRAKQSQASVTAADWITPTITGLKATKKAHLLITANDIKLYTAGSYQDPLIVFYDEGNPSGTIASKVYSSLFDQDGKEYTWNYIYCLVEDLNGKVWMGTNNGVVELIPANALNSDFTINHLKVPRNDGTNYADYLLNDTPVTCIAVDGANRKWLGTETSGLFLASSDGSEVLKQFNTSNSYLTDNHVISVLCNPNSNSVYVGTPSGLLEYSSDAAPGEASYDNIYAFPNPVRPDYTGLITIRGLMENSLVKIADAAGNVIKSMKSIGGMATWDGCNASGSRVKSGIYYVLSSQNENESSSGVVTKILIIR